MLLTKAELDLGKLASKDESRYWLQGIAVDKDETVVTNGHYLVRVAHGGSAPENWPHGETPVTMAHVNDEPILITRDAAINAAKTLPRRTTIPILSQAALSSDGTLHTNPLDGKEEFPAKMEGRFPNWKAVMPHREREPAIVIGLGADYLTLIAKFISDHHKTHNPGGAHIKLTIWDAESPILIESQTDDGQTVEAVLMPQLL